MNPTKVQRLLKGLTMSSKTLSLQLKNIPQSESSHPILLKVSPHPPKDSLTPAFTDPLHSSSDSSSSEEIANLYNPIVLSNNAEKEDKLSISIEDGRDTVRNTQRQKIKNQTMRKQALKKKYGGSLFCRITRAVCAFLFLLSVLIAIIGIAITYTNAESDMLRVLGQQITSNTAPQLSWNDIQWTAGLVLGVVFFSTGIVGTCRDSFILMSVGACCSSLGICCSSFFLCAQHKGVQE